MSARFGWLPLCEVNFLLLVDVDPKLFVTVVPNALVLLVKPVKSATNNIILSLYRRAIQLNPLTLLD